MHGRELSTFEDVTDWLESEEVQTVVAIQGTLAKLKDLYKLACGSTGPVGYIVGEIAFGILTNVMKCGNFGFIDPNNSAPRRPLAPLAPRADQTSPARARVDWEDTMQRATNCAAKTTDATMTGWAERLCSVGKAYDSCGQDAAGAMILAELFDSSDVETYDPIIGLGVGVTAGVSAAGTVVGGIVLDVATCVYMISQFEGCGGDCHPPDTMLQVRGAQPLPPLLPHHHHHHTIALLTHPTLSTFLNAPHTM